MISKPLYIAFVLYCYPAPNKILRAMSLGIMMSKCRQRLSTHMLTCSQCCLREAVIKNAEIVLHPPCCHDSALYPPQQLLSLLPRLLP